MATTKPAGKQFVAAGLPGMNSATNDVPSHAEVLRLLGQSNLEVKTMQQSLDFYESENKRLVDELHSATIVQQANSTKLADFEKMRQSLQKKVLIGEKSLKFEKVASEGLSKKASLLGQELDDAKESHKNLFDEVQLSRKRIMELEKSLSSGRALRLKEMHENELFKRQISGLEARMAEAEEGNRQAQTDLLSKIQQLETAIAVNQAQGRTVAAQNEEMVALAREVCALREKQRVLLDRTRRLEHVAAVCARERDAFEREVQRLRLPMLRNVPPASQALQLQQSTGVGAELAREMQLYQQQLDHDQNPELTGDNTDYYPESQKPKLRATAAYRGAHALTRPRIGARGQTKGVIGGQGGAGAGVGASSVLSTTSPSKALPYRGVTAMDSKWDRAAPEELGGGGEGGRQANTISSQTVARIAQAGRPLVGASNNGHDSSSISNAHVFLHDSVHRSLSAEATPHRLSKALAHSTQTGHSQSYSASYLRDPTRYTPITVAPSAQATAAVSGTSYSKNSNTAEVAAALASDGSGATDEYGFVAAASTTAHRSSKKTTSRQTAAAKNDATTALGLKPKSLFVGSGLGLRNDPEGKDRFQPTGSAKQVLKRIFAEFED